MNFNTVVKAVGLTLGKYAPQILTGIGIAGFGTAIIFMHQAAPAAKDIVFKEKYERKVEKLPWQDTLKLTWKLYIPTVTMVAISTACIIGGQYIVHKRLAAMTAAYVTVADAATKYQNKVKELVGPTKEAKIHEEVAKDEVNEIPESQFEKAQSIDGGEDYFVDELSGRVFKSDLDKIKKAVNEFNYQLLNEMFCTVNDLYNWIGLERIDLGEVVGWNIDKGMVEFKYDTVLRGDKPVVVIRPAAYPEARRLA